MSRIIMLMFAVLFLFSSNSMAQEGGRSCRSSMLGQIPVSDVIKVRYSEELFTERLDQVEAARRNLESALNGGWFTNKQQPRANYLVAVHNALTMAFGIGKLLMDKGPAALEALRQSEEAGGLRRLLNQLDLVLVSTATKKSTQLNDGDVARKLMTSFITAFNEYSSFHAAYDGRAFKLKSSGDE